MTVRRCVLLVAILVLAVPGACRPPKRGRPARPAGPTAAVPEPRPEIAKPDAAEAVAAAAETVEPAAAPGPEPDAEPSVSPAPRLDGVLGPEPDHGTRAWRHWCAVEYHPRAAVPRSAAPEIDGALDDPAWRGAGSGGFVDPTGSEASPATAFYVAHDDDTLYLAARLEEPLPARIRAVAERPGGRVLRDDHLQIDLAPRWRSDAYTVYRFIADPNGAGMLLADARPLFSAEVRAAAQVGETTWTFELAVPLAQLDVRVEDLPGQVWACRVVRRRRTTGTTELSSWTRLLDDRDDESVWGHLLFPGAPHSPEPEPEEPLLPAEEAAAPDEE